MQHQIMIFRSLEDASLIAPIYMYYVAPETPMMSSVTADCPDLAPPIILDKSTPMYDDYDDDDNCVYYMYLYL